MKLLASAVLLVINGSGSSAINMASMDACQTARSELVKRASPTQYFCPVGGACEPKDGIKGIVFDCIEGEAVERK